MIFRHFLVFLHAQNVFAVISCMVFLCVNPLSPGSRPSSPHTSDRDSGTRRTKKQRTGMSLTKRGKKGKKQIIGKRNSGYRKSRKGRPEKFESGKRKKSREDRRRTKGCS